ncbi:MAG: hypothetical protein H0U59_14010 [Gemmatimonadaceae bacterium]|nr:hypothetical protein [Gemmatimonadaceae bacterium]
MHFQHSPGIWADYPELTAAALFAEGLTTSLSVDSQVARYNAIAKSRLETDTEASFPEIQAWRRAFSRMGLKPTQYRCASESLLRRFRKDDALPRMHPLIDLCNAMSRASATPVAVFDVSRVTDSLEVRHASGNEFYESFSGEIEYPDAHEVIFADSTRRAHARRWTNRQSGYSAVRDTTKDVLIVIEAMHVAAIDVQELAAALAHDLNVAWSITPKTAILSQSSPRFEF